MVIKVKQTELFDKWLEWLHPIMPLKENDRKVLAALITLHYLHKDRYSAEVLMDLLMSDDTKNIIAKRLDMSINQVNKSYMKFKEMDIITEDNKLQNSLIKYPLNNRFRILVDFEITD